jgi:hypothetical protein
MDARQGILRTVGWMVQAFPAKRLAATRVRCELCGLDTQSCWNNQPGDRSRVDCCALRHEFWVDDSFVSQITDAITFPAGWQSIFLVPGGFECLYRIQAGFVSGVKRCTHVSSPVIMVFCNSFPSSLNRLRCERVISEHRFLCSIFRLATQRALPLQEMTALCTMLCEVWMENSSTANESVCVGGGGGGHVTLVSSHNLYLW